MKFNFPSYDEALREATEIYELASLEAAELDSPNSPGYDALVERISERIYNERYPSSV